MKSRNIRNQQQGRVEPREGPESRMWPSIYFLISLRGAMTCFHILDKCSQLFYCPDYKINQLSHSCTVTLLQLTILSLLNIHLFKFCFFQTPEYQAKKKQSKELRQKLFHIKRLVKIYDQGFCQCTLFICPERCADKNSSSIY